MRLFSILILFAFSGSASSARLSCDYQQLGLSFGGSETITFLKLALEYQDFDFSTVDNAFEMQQILDEKKAIKDMYNLYKESPFIWGETYNKMYPLCDDSQKKTLFAKAFTFYESRWKQINSFDIDEQMEMVQYMNEFDLVNHTASKIFKIKSYEHFMSIFSNAIQNIENNLDVMRSAVKGERESTKRENLELEKQKKEVERLVAEQEAANEEKRRLQAEIREQQERLKRLEAQNGRINNSQNKRVSPSSSSAGNRTIKRNSIICYSERAYDKQMNALAQGDNRLFSGCIVSSSSTKAWFDDISMFSGTCTLLNSNRSKKLWVNCESIVD